MNNQSFPEDNSCFTGKSRFTVTNSYINGFLTYKNMFSPEECQEIIRHPEFEPLQNSADILLKNIKGNSAWIRDKLNKLVFQSNKLYFNFDISSVKELFLLECAEGSSINWHMDIGPTIASTRKITVITYLTEPDEYEGGNINLSLKKPNKEYLLRDLGTVNLMPSLKPYCLEPVTRGTVKILLAFMHGNSFC
jgi:hypothetical protein